MSAQELNSHAVSSRTMDKTNTLLEVDRTRWPSFFIFSNFSHLIWVFLTFSIFDTKLNLSLFITSHFSSPPLSLSLSNLTKARMQILLKIKDSICPTKSLLKRGKEGANARQVQAKYHGPKRSYTHTHT